jgi:hypothetical protein
MNNAIVISTSVITLPNNESYLSNDGKRIYNHSGQTIVFPKAKEKTMIEKLEELKSKAPKKRKYTKKS